MLARAANTPASSSQRLMVESGIFCSMNRSGNVWDNAAMESFFSSPKTERTPRCPADANLASRQAGCSVASLGPVHQTGSSSRQIALMPHFTKLDLNHHFLLPQSID